MTNYCPTAWALYDLRERLRDQIETATPAARARLVLEYRNANRELIQHRIECSGKRTGGPEDDKYCTMPVRPATYEEVEA